MIMSCWKWRLFYGGEPAGCLWKNKAHAKTRGWKFNFTGVVCFLPFKRRKKVEAGTAVVVGRANLLYSNMGPSPRDI